MQKGLEMAVSKIGTVLPKAKVKYIDDSGNAPKWVTVAECVDAPKQIGIALDLARKHYKGKTFWIFHVYGKEIAR